MRDSEVRNDLCHYLDDITLSMVSTARVAPGPHQQLIFRMRLISYHIFYQKTKVSILTCLAGRTVLHANNSNVLFNVI